MSNYWGLGDDEGATAVEYAIMVSLIAVVIIVAVTALGINLKASFDCSAENIGALPANVTCP
jgi:Flp pilus assembly pilin Flp